MPRIDRDALADAKPSVVPIDETTTSRLLDAGDKWPYDHKAIHHIKEKGGSADTFRPTHLAGTDGVPKVHLTSDPTTGNNRIDFGKENVDAHVSLPERQQSLGDIGPSGGTGGTGETGGTSYESFRYTAHDENTIDDLDWVKKIENEYPMDQLFSVFQARIFSEHVVDHQGELIAKTHPPCTTRELTPFAEASDPGTEIDVTDTFGGNTKKQIFPSSLYTILYDLHYAENCEDPFTPDKGKFSLSARTADFSDANTQAVDSSYFSLDPIAKVGAFAIGRRTTDRALLKVDGDELATHGYLALPVVLKFTQKNKYGQTCSTHGDQIELELIGKHKHLFEAGFAVVRKIYTKCTDEGRTDIAEEIERLKKPDTNGNRLGHTSYGVGHTPTEATEADGVDYQILFKSPCIKLTDAKTKDCKGNTLIKVYVKHKHGDATALGI